jgi:hypothetical protein
MDPSPSELACMTTVSEVLLWANLAPSLEEIRTPTSSAGSLLALLGLLPSSLPRDLAMVSELDFVAEFGGWVTFSEGGAPAGPSVVGRGRAKVFLRVCHLLCGIVKTQAVLANEAASAAALTASAAAAVLATSAAQPSVVAIRKAKMANVLKQGDESEVDILDTASIIAMFGRYEVLFGPGSKPGEDVEPSSHQLAALKMCMADGAAPYADFAVFGPHGLRLEKKHKLEYMVYQLDGTFKTKEIYGPPTIQAWMASYRVLECSLIMLDAVDLGILASYSRNMLACLEGYGVETWHVLYQADLRMREERMDRMLREIISEEAKAPGSVPGWSAVRPWNAVWSRAARDYRYWQSEFKEKALFLITRSAPKAALIDDDVRISARAIAPPQFGQLGKGQSQRSASSGGYGKAPKPPKEKAHNTNAEGYITNRRQVALCLGWQDGTCTTTLGAGLCQLTGLAHQCSKCLSSSHGALLCPTPDAYKGKGERQGQRKG